MINVAGTTSSSNFPTTPGVYQGALKSGQDAFVAKLSAGGSTLVFSTFLGGGGNDNATALAVGSSGEATVAGWTESNDFPVSSGALRKTRANRDGFVARLSSPGNSLLMSTLVGGSGEDVATGLAVDSGGNAYVGGYTASRDFAVTKPVVTTAPTGSPLDAIRVLQDIMQQVRSASYQGGDYDAFLLKVKSDGTSLLYGRYLGGAGSDVAYALALDASGDVLIAGKTNSLDFPVSYQAAQQAYGGGPSDGFVAKFSGADGRRIFATYAGGRGEDVIAAIAAAGSSGFAAAGYTLSDNLAAGAVYYNTLAPGGYDAFIRKWDASGTVSWSCYLGGGGYSSSEQALDVALDSDGNLYVTGVTASTNFPTTPGAIQPAFGGAPFIDAFVTKIDKSGTQILYSTYLGGFGDDLARGIAVDGSGNAYVVGRTNSIDFPVTSGAIQDTLRGGTDAFAVKLNPRGDSLVYGTLLGGLSSDEATGVAVDSTGNAYVTGYSYGFLFPTTPNVVQASATGSYDGFVSKLSPDGTHLVYSTFLGGEDIDWPRRIAVDSAGIDFITGVTRSTRFPVSIGALQTKIAGGADAFLTKLNPTATSLVYSTYLGGSSDDEALSVALDASGNAVIAGYTNSSNFPVIAGAYQATNKGSSDGFVARFKNDGSGLLNSTLLGGRSDDGIGGLAIGADGRIFVGGWTGSSDFPTTQTAYQSGLAGGYDAFLAVLNAGLTSLDHSSFLGGRTDDQASAIAVDHAGNVYLAGFATSVDFPMSPNTFQPALGGAQNAFVAKIDISSSVVIPKPEITRVVNYYSGGAVQAPGMIASIEGHNLAGSTVVVANPLDKYSGTLPPSIAGTSVRVFGQFDAPLFSVSPDKIVAQLPYTGMMQFTVTVQGQKSANFIGSFANAFPGVAAVYKQDLSPITQDSPSKPGDTVLAYIVGGGETTPPSAAGVPTPSSPVYNLNQTQSPVVETDEVGQGHLRMMCDVKSEHMVPGMVGVAEVQVVLNPQISSDAIAWDFSFLLGNTQSNKVRIFIKSASQ